ncbi:hypothetical protein BDZ90DRAFT_122588 [Jaminaea rosea]|uniref:Uncharacterized protein n=1 Tax=Jaminaea rosea TaxID=1569628 RepID=A0A316UGC4_9BASI|nr:hypothetical protein BDZ90DRAFT_122588 [Jaminaea rosea]PWN24377.1 hypothetical protein BDZ90DRAFT_122588 [Jaminaea rosea]
MEADDVWATPADAEPVASASTTAAISSASTSRPASKAFYDDDLGAGWAASSSPEQDRTISKPAEEAGKEEQPVVEPTEVNTKAGDEDGEEEAEDDDEFADFDDDAGGPAAPGGGGDDDDFGDFGDFADDAVPAGMELPEEPEQATPPTPAAPPTAADWQPLSIPSSSSPASASSSLSRLEDLTTQISSLLPPTLTTATTSLPNDPIRQTPGLSQVLQSESSRAVYTDLSAQPTTLQPVDWLRSRTRRDLHISLGVPINLDEIMPAEAGATASGSRLPPLTLQVDSLKRAKGEQGPNSAPVSGGERGGSSPATTNGSGAGSGAGVEKRSGSVDANRRQRIMEKRKEDLGLGPTPEVDMKRIEEVCALREGKSLATMPQERIACYSYADSTIYVFFRTRADQLSLLPLPSLRDLSRELGSLTSTTSVVLTHHLTLRESLQADSEMYNGLIKDLVRGAASSMGSAKERKSVQVGATRRMGGGSASGSSSPRPASPFGRPAMGSAGSAVVRK